MYEGNTGIVSCWGVAMLSSEIVFSATDMLEGDESTEGTVNLIFIRTDSHINR